MRDALRPTTYRTATRDDDRPTPSARRNAIGRPRVVNQPDTPPAPTTSRRALRSQTDPERYAAPSGRRSAISDSAQHRSLLSGVRVVQSLRDLPDDDWDESDWTPPHWDDEPDDEYEEAPRRALSVRESSGRMRAASSARPLPSIRSGDRALVAKAFEAVLSTDSAPALQAYRAPRRKRLDTRAIMQSARKPWSLTRTALAILAIVFAIVTGRAVAGEASQPLMGFGALAGTGAVANVAFPGTGTTVADRVPAQTQGRRADLYDSVDQFNQWWGAACSAAVLSEVLTAYGAPNITIGHMIDELGSDISPYGGLETYDGFNKVAAKHGFRADLYMDDHPLSYAQMKYLTNTLGLPVIVNVRMSYGYYHYFSGGHFMVMTAGDDQGLRLVDSSLYYTKYMPLGVFNSMFTHRTIVIVPQDYKYTLP